MLRDEQKVQDNIAFMQVTFSLFTSLKTTEFQFKGLWFKF